MPVRAQRMGDEEPRDAICVHLEAPGEAIRFFLPYERGEDGRVAWGEAFFGPADAEIFPAGDAAAGPTPP
jgi:hypothetical protein